MAQTQGQDPNSELVDEIKGVVKPVEQAAQQAAQQVAEQPAAQEAKKAYYNPGEVMKKKGCIGCGGMVLAVPFLVAVLGLVIAL